jgi:hypothetical protein
MLPPLAGEKCVTCGELIASYSEGSFCPDCGNATHNACLRADASGLTDGKCARCGGDPQYPLAVEVRKERNQALMPTLGATALTVGAGTEPPSEASFAAVLVWVLRLMAAACVIVLIYQIGAIEDAATKAETKSAPEFKDGEIKPGETIRPSTSGPIFMAVLYTAGAAAVLLALAEILRLHVAILRRFDEEDLPDEDEETGTAPQPEQAQPPLRDS